MTGIDLIETIYPDATPDDPSDNPRTQSEYDADGHHDRQRRRARPAHG